MIYAARYELPPPIECIQPRSRVTGLSWARALPFPFCARLTNVQVWISGNNGPRVIREGLYLLCVDREAEPGFGHTDQVSLAFRLTLGLYQELCRVYSAFS